jgi:hypothetical protein
VITIPTNLPAESALQPLRDFVASSGELSGDLSDGRFSLRLRPSHRKACPVSVSGRVIREAGRTLVAVRASPPPWMIGFFLTWVAFGAFVVVGFGRRSTTRAEVVVFGLFVLAGVAASIWSFLSELRRAYEIIRRVYAA